MELMFRRLIVIVVTTWSLMRNPALAADGYWLDQYNALLYTATLRLDSEFAEMRHQGAVVVMVQADSLPDLLLRWIAWRARDAGLQPVAWIQKPSPNNLHRVGALTAYNALQVDDHFFARPPVSLALLRTRLAPRQLWCSFQPGQYSWQSAQYCDHVDIQVYRQSCQTTVDRAYQLGVAGRHKTAIAVYHNGSATDDRRMWCFHRQFRAIGNQLFVFKWKNPEHWLTPLTRPIWHLLSRLRQKA